MHRLLSDRLLCLKETISPSYPFLGLLLLREGLLLLRAVHLEMDNALKWPRCNKVSGHKTSNVLWKEGEVFLIENLTLFLIPKRGRKYSHTNSYDSYYARWSSHCWSLSCWSLSCLYLAYLKAELAVRAKGAAKHHSQFKKVGSQSWRENFVKKDPATDRLYKTLLLACAFRPTSTLPRSSCSSDDFDLIFIQPIIWLRK